jgi:rare lipoprotein A
MRALAPAVFLVALCACTSTGRDGPPAGSPVDLDRVGDAKPRVEPLHRGANNPYTVLGKKYVPYQSIKPYRQRGIASWYGRKFHGRPTSSGERYDMYAMSAAHTVLPIPSYVRVTHLDNGRSVVVRINDRGPFHADRIIDLSYAAAHKLRLLNAGSARVEVEIILPGKLASSGRPASP